MKKVFALLLVLAVTTALEVMAGDDYAGITLTSAAPATVCSAQLTPKKKYAIQPKDGNVYVHLSTNGEVDGGTADTATANDVTVSSGQLYDIPTTYNQRYICVLATSGTVNVKVYINRNTQE